jgi:hypothetical protein
VAGDPQFLQSPADEMLCPGTVNRISAFGKLMDVRNQSIQIAGLENKAADPKLGQFRFYEIVGEYGDNQYSGGEGQSSGKMDQGQTVKLAQQQLCYENLGLEGFEQCLCLFSVPAGSHLIPACQNALQI